MTKKIRPNSIVALCIVSESELVRVLPLYNKEFEQESPTVFSQVLFNLGVDTSLTIERQDGLWHRNRLNEVVLCSRFVGYERLDSVWITSGYASQAAKDKASGCRLLEDMYRSKNLTEDRQDALASRDRYRVVDQEYA
jgi:hypothetical protein